MSKNSEKFRANRAKVIAYLVKEFIDDLNIPPRPWVVLGEPSIDDLEVAFSKFPEFDDMISEGVLISTRVYDAERDPTDVIGFVNSIQIEGIGSTPEEAVANTLSGVEFDTLEAMQKKANAVFEPFWDALGVGIRRPDEERGIFLKVDNRGRVIIQDKYRKIDMEATRRKAHEWQTKMVEMQRVISVGYLDEIVKRQRVVENALDQYTTALRRKGRLEVATRAAELSREAAKSLKEADEARREASKYSKILGGLSIVQNIIGIASTVNNQIQQNAQKKALDSISNELNSTNAQISYLESSIKNLSGQITDMHRNLKAEIDAIAPSNNLIIINNSIQIDFSDSEPPIGFGDLN